MNAPRLAFVLVVGGAVLAVGFVFFGGRLEFFSSGRLAVGAFLCGRGRLRMRGRV